MELACYLSPVYFGDSMKISFRFISDFKIFFIEIELEGVINKIMWRYHFKLKKRFQNFNYIWRFK